MTPQVAQEDVPYVIVTVDLDGGARLFGRLVSPGDAQVGQRVCPSSPSTRGGPSAIRSHTSRNEDVA